MSPTAPTTADLDRVTIDLLFALRDSLTDEGPTRLEFWTGGRAESAITAAAAGSETAAQAITTAAAKLQIRQYDTRHARTLREIATVIDTDYQAWARHVDQTMAYILALATIERDNRKTKPTPKPAPTATTEELTF